MKAHEIDMVGKFWLKRETGSVSWTAVDRGRLLYSSADLLYYGNNAAWRRVAVGDESTFALKASDNAWTATQSPNADNTYALGQTNKRWTNVYAVTFTGTVTTATYADLAEMYKTPLKYPVGSVVKVSEDPAFDVCLADVYDENVLGVISTKPGFILNFEESAITGMQPVGLVGRVPVRVIGAIRKGHPVMSAGEGLAVVWTPDYPAGAKIGVALETNLEMEEKLVECSIK